MHLDELWLMEAEREHWDALHRTGYWGKQSAGSLPFARDTRRFLLALRSELVTEPFTWGTWGGAVNRGESPQQAALRELHEEAGYHGPADLVPLYVYRDQSFRYSNFLAVVDHEFTPPPWRPYPKPGWETRRFRWCEFGKWPEPLHFGLDALLNDAASVQTIKRFLHGEEEAARQS